MRADRIHDVVGRQPARAQLPGVEVDLDLALLAAERIRNGGARHRGELGAQDVVAEIEYLLLGYRLARERQLQDRHARGVIGQNERRGGAGRRALQLRLRYGDDLRHRQILVGVRLEEIFHHRRAVDGLRFGVLDVIDDGLRGALGEQDDAVGDFLRQQTRVAPNHRRNRDLDIGKDIGRHAENGVDAEKNDQRGQHDEGIGPLQGYSNDPHRLLRSVPRSEGALGKRVWEYTERPGARAEEALETAARPRRRTYSDASNLSSFSYSRGRVGELPMRNSGSG